MNTDLYHPHNSGSALTNGFNRANAVPASPYSQQYSPFTNQDDGYPPLRQQSIDIQVPNVPTIDTSYASHPGSAYGSPRDEELTRFGSAFSPVAGKGLSVLDAPLPASFDSQGISWIARHGPVASSVPSKFGLESPPGSIGNAKDGRTSDALKSLHSSAFGDDTRDRFNGTASSPPAPQAEEYFGKRAMHSTRMTARSKVSASLPKNVDQDWEFPFEEELIPGTLSDILTPQEKARRGSRTNGDDDGRPIHSGTGTPNADTPTKFGSPSNASPSRWNAFFAKEGEERPTTSTARTSSFGHVGSPLRNSSLHPMASPSSRPIARPTQSGDTSPYVASPPRQSSMSIISQQLQRTKLARVESGGTESSLHPSRASSNLIGSGSSRVGERQVSSSSIGNGIGSGRFTTPIDEEQGDFVFSMEGMEDVDEKKGEKRNSGGWTYAGSTRSPNLGSVSAPRNGTINGSTGLEGMFGTR